MPSVDWDAAQEKAQSTIKEKRDRGYVTRVDEGVKPIQELHEIMIMKGVDYENI